MKIIKLITVAIFTFCIIQACGDQTKAVANTAKKDFTCTPMEILANGDTINKTTADGIKEGLWISFGYIVPNGKDPVGAAVKAIRSKGEEGYYRNNKKEGFWKFYDKNDGKLIDSVEYKNDNVVK